MARRVTRRGKAILSAGLHPHYVSVAQTMARFTGDTLDVALPELTDGSPGHDMQRLLDGIDATTPAGLRDRALIVSVRPGPPCAGAVTWEDRRSAWSDEGSSA